MSIVYWASNTLYYNNKSFLQTNYSKDFNNFGLFKPLYISKCTCLKAQGNFNLNNRSGKKKNLCCGFLSTLSRIINIYSQLQSVYYKALSFCYKFLDYCFYIFENLIDILIFLGFSLLMIGGWFKYLFVFHSNGYFW